MLKDEHFEVTKHPKSKGQPYKNRSFLSIFQACFMRIVVRFPITSLADKNGRTIFLAVIFTFLYFENQRFLRFSWIFSGSLQRFSGSPQRFPELACRRRNTGQFRKLWGEPENFAENLKNPSRTVKI